MAIIVLRSCRDFPTLCLRMTGIVPEPLIFVTKALSGAETDMGRREAIIRWTTYFFAIHFKRGTVRRPCNNFEVKRWKGSYCGVSLRYMVICENLRRRQCQKIYLIIPCLTIPIYFAYKQHTVFLFMEKIIINNGTAL